MSRKQRFRLHLLVLLPCALWSVAAHGAPASGGLNNQAVDVLHRAMRFMRDKVAVQGSYLWTYSPDLSVRKGEGIATVTQGWVQSGTSAVGNAYLDAFQATEHRAFLDAARQTGHALTQTQLASGGWTYRIEFDPAQSRNYYTRRDAEAGDRAAGRRNNRSTYDDDNTQGALRFLMRLDQLLSGSDAEVRRSIDYGLNKLQEAQFPNGAWPTAYKGLPPDSRYATRQKLKARFPASSGRTWQNPAGDPYDEAYMLQDHGMRDTVRTMLMAHKLYKKPAYLESARRGGDFLLSAQLPAPQTGWAQQYDAQMQPRWARKFEPPAVASLESAGVVQVLTDLYLYTGDPKYFDSAARGVAWLKSSRLPDGRWARFYELRSNDALFVTPEFQLTKDPSRLLKYGFYMTGTVSKPIAYYEEVAKLGRDGFIARRAQETKAEAASGPARLENRVRQIIASLDAQGRWMSGGEIKTADFVRNFTDLSHYVAVSRKKTITHPAGRALDWE